MNRWVFKLTCQGIEVQERELNRLKKRRYIFRYVIQRAVQLIFATRAEERQILTYVLAGAESYRILGTAYFTFSTPHPEIQSTKKHGRAEGEQKKSRRKQAGAEGDARNRR